MEDKESKTGWKTVFRIYPSKNFWRGLVRPVILWSLFVLLFFVFDYDAINVLTFCTEFVKSVFPNLIGFILTAHALLIGFSGSDFLLKLAKKTKGDKYSYLQIVNSTFAVIEGVLVFVQLIGFVIAWVMSKELFWPFAKGCCVYNDMVCLLFLFCIIYALFSLLDVIINVFNLGQISYYIAENKLNEVSKNAEQEKNKEIFSLNALFRRFFYED